MILNKEYPRPPSVGLCESVARQTASSQRVYQPNDGLKAHNGRPSLGDDQNLHRHGLCSFSIWFHRTLGIMRHGPVYAPIFNQNPWILKPRRRSCFTDVWSYFI